LSFPQTQRPLGTTLVRDGNRLLSVLMDYELAGSMFTRLFYFENSDDGLVHFDKFHRVIDVTGAKILVWKIDWAGTSDVIIEPEVAPVTHPEQTDEAVDMNLLKVEHILISTADRSESEAMELAQDIKSQATVENFKDLADEYSDCGTIINCEIPWFGKGVMEESFDDIVFNLKKGEISEPFMTNNGYEIVYLVDTK